MSTTSPSLTTRHTGFGLGLRTTHYNDFLANKQAVDWLEIITDNYLIDGGKPLVVLDQIRRDYPVAMHGVAMSLGEPGGLNMAYLNRVKQLAQRIEPLWVSDHLCWTGVGPTRLHDLYPLPYTDEAAQLIIDNIRRAQDVLQRRLVIENVSSYVGFKASSISEWQFLSHVAQAADCLLLLDVNNVYVSSVNHGFDPVDYLRGLPANRVQQIHLAGHSDCGDHIIDTHDHPVAPAVWDLYGQARALFGPVAAMIERDAHIPPLPELIAELNVARDIAARIDASTAPEHCAMKQGATGLLHASPEITPPGKTSAEPSLAATSLPRTQALLRDYMLAPLPEPDAAPTPASMLIHEPPRGTAARRLGIYHHAYRARLCEVLAETFAKTYLFMGSDLFDQEATQFAVVHPPTQPSLNRYGQGFAEHLASRYPDNPELFELARLDWDLRCCFDSADTPALSATEVQSDSTQQWLNREHIIHPSLQLREIQTNVIQVWHAIDADQEVPAQHLLEQPHGLVIWRKGLQPHFQSIDPGPARFLQQLCQGRSIAATCEQLADSDVLNQPQQLAQWLQHWLAEGWLSAMTTSSPGTASNAAPANTADHRPNHAVHSS